MNIASDPVIGVGFKQGVYTESNGDKVEYSVNQHGGLDRGWHWDPKKGKVCAWGEIGMDLSHDCTKDPCMRDKIINGQTEIFISHILHGRWRQLPLQFHSR